MEKLLGVVMCGGESKRMGTDKGLLSHQNKTWAQLIYNQLTELEVVVVVSINQNQITKYSQIFGPEKLIVDSLDIEGPLNGILSVHTQYPDKDILIMACDMIAMDKPTLQQLANAYHQNQSYNYYTYHNGNFFEPLCAIYTAKALNQLMIVYKNEGLDNYRLQNILINGNTQSLPVTDISRFKNRNQ